MTFLGSAVTGGVAVFGVLLQLTIVNVGWSYLSPTQSTFTEAVAAKTGLPANEVL